MGLVFTSQTIFKNFNNINKIVLELSVFLTQPNKKSQETEDLAGVTCFILFFFSHP